MHGSCFELLRHMIHRLTRLSARVPPHVELTFRYWTPLITHRITFVMFDHNPPIYPVGIGPAELKTGGPISLITDR